MKIIFKPEPKPIEVYNPYKDRLFTCSCGVKFVVEDSDIFDIETKSIMEVDSWWYEHNMPRNARVHYLKCICGNMVCLDRIIDGTCWADGEVKVGGEPYKKD